jgi:hypothetical protein
MNKQLRDLVERAERWPPDAQEALVHLGLEIEAGQGGVYHADGDELEAIDDADRGGVADPRTVETLLAKFRSK